MADYSSENLAITFDKKGADRYTKVTYPIRYGRYHEIRTTDHIFDFNLNGEIKYIRGRNDLWPHPVEWLKRTVAGDWVYYTTGAYNEVFSYLGEYYRPCLSYPSNSLWDYDPFSDSGVGSAINAWSGLAEELKIFIKNGLPARAKERLARIASCDGRALRERSRTLHQIIGGRVSVLPPDTRHVDYDVIPIMIADGCLYRCGFCCLKTGRHYQTRPPGEIRSQINALKHHFAADLRNYNAVFLGNHDALAAGRDLICMAAEEAYSVLAVGDAYIKGPALFLFGSVDSFLGAGNRLLETLNRMPYYTYINIGMESVHGRTLGQLEKPVSVSMVKAAFEKMIGVNRSFHNLEVTANFVMGEDLPGGHYTALNHLVCSHLERYYSKGALYLSPLNSSQIKAALQKTFIDFKNRSRLPTFIYLIQRL